MKPCGISRSSMTINSIWKLRGRRPTLRKTCKVFIPRDLSKMDTLRIPATYEEDPYIVQKLKAFTKHKIHHIILVSAISFYLYSGALMFQYMESDCSCKKTLNITEHREVLIQHIYRSFYELGDQRHEWQKVVEKKVRQHEDIIFEYVGLENTTITATICDGWSLKASIFYCFTLITTIGYGDISPCSNAGRAMTTLYAALGVPLMFLVLADLGKLFTKVLKVLYRYFKRLWRIGTFRLNIQAAEDKPLQYMTVSWRTVGQNNSPLETKDDNAISKKSLNNRSNQVTTLTIHNDELYKNLDFLNPDEKNHKHVEVQDDFHLPITLAIAMVIVYMVVGMVIFQRWEDWNYFESFYFVFISMTTIGLGDYTPQHEVFMMGGFVYLVLGLVLNSMCINVIQEKLTATFQKAKVRIGNDTVLNVHSLLEDDDHRSRIPQYPNTTSDSNENCIPFKMTLRKNSISESTAWPDLQSSKSFYKAIRKVSEGDVTSRDETNFLKVPLQHRFKFYDSPYSTVHDDCQITITSIKKY